MPSHYKVKEYCPNVFRNLREQFGVDSVEYLRSLTAYEPEPDLLDGGFQSMDSEAVAELHSVLRDYHEYVVEKLGKTLLPQYLGLYRLTIEGTETYLIVMRNVFGRKYNVHTKFDLKVSVFFYRFICEDICRLRALTPIMFLLVCLSSRSSRFYSLIIV
ncbi:unnamed protein product [Cylicostephanus goldi]|uniref:PIPK domain-containing protein n=1 Tax=Cylicostephanus goldi TaxID=71465 RepID=A0A3P7QXW5_CYLGO|nr:unnamed protein product [Cylicostephanus goldi]